MISIKALAFVLTAFVSYQAPASVGAYDNPLITFASQSYLNGNLKLSSSQRKELDCYAKVIWFEARGESKRGKILVANVVRNRMNFGKPFATTVCDVVYQRNQFAWTRDKKKRNTNFKNIAQINLKTEGQQVMDTLNVAFAMLLMEPKSKTKATHFCSIGERCQFGNVKRLGKVGNHTFFEYLGNS